MKNKSLFVLVIFFLSFYGFSQDCVTQKAVSDDEICSGQTASITLSSSEIGVTYILRDGTTNIPGQTFTGNGGDLIFSPSPTTTTIYNVYVLECGFSYDDLATVTVNPIPDVTASIATQTICSGESITDILFSSSLVGTDFNWVRNNTTNVTGISNNGSGNSISGSLTNNTLINQTVTFTITPVSPENCNGNYITVTVIVYPTPYANITNGSQTICSGNNISTISFTGITGTIYEWTRDNNTNVTGISNSGSGNISGILTNTTSIQQIVTFTITPIRNNCPGTPVTTTVTVEPISVGGAVTVSQPNVSPVVRTTTLCHVGSGTLYLSGHYGNIVRWESSTNAGITWAPITNTNDTYNFTNLTQTTVYRAVIKNEPNCALAYSTSAMVNIIPNLRPSPVAATPAIICNGDSSVLTSQSSYATSSLLATGGTFTDANPPGWSVGGCPNCLNASSSNTTQGPWRLSATNGGTYSGINYTSSGKFAIVNGEYNSILYTPTFNTYGLSTASLTFNHAYNLLAGAWGKIEISVNGGAYVTLAQFNGPSALGPYNNFSPTSIDLNAYLGQPNLRLRFNYHGVGASSWAVDNIQIPDAPVNLSTQWVDSITGEVISNNANMTVTPSVTTTYAITSFLNGCNSFGTDGTAYVTVTVNQRPTAVIGEDQFVCLGGTARMNINFTGSAPWRITYFNGTTSTTINNINSNPYVLTIPNVTTNRTYTITALSDSKCTAIPSDITGSATITVLNGTRGVWTGLVSNDWFDCMNWEGGLPNATVDAVIPNTVSIMPIIDPQNSPYAAAYNNIANARDIIIANGASLGMTLNSNLEVKRNWINSGTFNPGQGTVTFNASTNNSVQTINSGINLSESFYNLITNCTNGALGVRVEDGFELTVINNLVLTQGDLRLIGEAQLVQNGSANNPAGGSGSLLKDQQGTKSSYHYNYWCSPVNPSSTNYTVASVLKDGTNSASSPFNPGNINFGYDIYYADGPLTNPIKISSRWIYKYAANSSDYFLWQAIRETGSIKVGEGFTMKGVTGTALNTDSQNYVFKGKPNNGDINLNLAVNQIYLVGNPYPSALDADAFIRDNIKDGGNASSNTINGVIYFWDHFGGQTHYLGQYVGGYATYSLMGGVVAISNDPLINSNGQTGSKTPKRYIAVGQGFFVQSMLDATIVANNPNLISPVTGGTVQFKNSQRVFKTESPANSIFFRNATSIVNTESDNRQKIRLSFEAPSGLKRQLLIGADFNTTDSFDLGYDAPLIDLNNDDMYWNLNDAKLVIQALPEFNLTTQVPVGIQINSEGTSKIKVDELENISSTTEIYLFDNVTGIYHDIKNDVFETNLSIGEYPNRFSLRFTNETLSNDDFENIPNSILIYVDSSEFLNIKNTSLDITAEVVYLYNLLGQKVATWNTEDEAQQNIKIPVDKFQSGTYIVKVKTNTGLLTKKIVIK